jgi:hypothetical protein
MVSQFGPQNRQLRFGDFGLKIITTFSWFESQNQAGFDLLVVSQNRRREDGVGHASRSSVLIHLEASHARLYQSAHKTGGGTTTNDARSIIVEAASRES